MLSFSLLRNHLVNRLKYAAKTIANANRIYTTTMIPLFKIASFSLKEYSITKTCPCNAYPLEPHFYSKIGLCRVIPIFLIVAPKHRLWVLVRTASAPLMAVLTCTYNLCQRKNDIFLIFAGLKRF